MAARARPRTVSTSRNTTVETDGRKEPEMLADFEFTYSQHDQTIRRAEANAQLLSTLTRNPTNQSEPSQTGRLAALLRRLARAPVAA